MYIGPIVKKDREKAIGEKVLAQAATCLRTLAHPARLRMVELLLSGRHTVGELAAACRVKPHVASEHLRLMEAHGMLKKERDGRKIYYRSAHAALAHIMDCIRERFGG
jgi:DNA-binding transcriptional ArsR family regulator